MRYYIIYRTTNKVNGKQYIGCHTTDDLDDGYLGSGLRLKRAVRKYGVDNFEREIIQECGSLEEMIEAEREWVTDIYVAREDTYNLQTGGLSYGILSEVSKDKISKSVQESHSKGLYANMAPGGSMSEENKVKISRALKERYEIHEHHRKGEVPWNKGKSLHYDVWAKGKKLGPMSEHEKLKRSETLKKRYEIHEHHRKGEAPWNKGMKMVTPSWNKGMEMPTVECPHCGKIGDRANMARWHFDNCKHKGAA